VHALAGLVPCFGLELSQGEMFEGAGEQIVAGGFNLLSTETYGRMGSVAHVLPKLLTDAAMSSAAGLEVTVTALTASALRVLSVALTWGNEIVYRELLSVYATAIRQHSNHSRRCGPIVDCE
jgi:hypothetical protein